MPRSFPEVFPGFDLRMMKFTREVQVIYVLNAYPSVVIILCMKVIRFDIKDK